jgi:formyl-CoA transferase
MSHMKAHPQTAALGMLQPVPEIDLDLMSLPLSLDGVRPSIRTRAPKLGQHNDALPEALRGGKSRG